MASLDIEGTPLIAFRLMCLIHLHENGLTKFYSVLQLSQIVVCNKNNITLKSCHRTDKTVSLGEGSGVCLCIMIFTD